MNVLFRASSHFVVLTMLLAVLVTCPRFMYQFEWESWVGVRSFAVP